METSAVEVVFDPLDTVRPEEAEELIAELRAVGVDAEATGVDGRGVVGTVTVVALVTLATTTVSGLCVVVAFMHRVFEVGVVVDGSRTPPRVRKDPTLPRGSVLTISRDGESTLTRNVSAQLLTELMQHVLGRRPKG